MLVKRKQERLWLVLLVCLTALFCASCALIGRLWLHAHYNGELAIAIERNDALAAEYCLQRGADPNMHVPQPESWLKRWNRIFSPKTVGDVDTPTVLVESLLGPGDEGDNATDHPDVTYALIKHGADVNLKGWGWVPINAAASQGKERSVKLLLDRGADANAGQGTGFPALFYAQVTPEIARVMLAHGANVNMRDHEGKTLLEYTYIRRYHPTSLTLAQVFLDRGADVTLKDKRGDSPLSMAARSATAATLPSDPWYSLFRRYAHKQRH